MRLLSRPHQLPARIAVGAYILNSGLGKRSAGPETAEGLHGMAAGTYPFLKDMEPVRFVRLLSTAEIALGAALLIPVVPSLLAGAALTAFAGGLVGLYLKTPGMREEGSLRPSQQGIGIAKDVWLLGIGAGLVVEELARD
ncbi:hypothetical protein [Streptosporangium sp. NPDC023615]|uniref:hypothetical protein n=1 Tax=Streptosporangium sp. NPDC023615 TaxID=3154794 RepID=UPI003414BFDE